MTAAAVIISLWVTACLEGTLHGEPKTLCREFQIRQYTSDVACKNDRDKAIADWLNDMKPFNLAPRVMLSKCAPAAPETDGDP